MQLDTYYPSIQIKFLMIFPQRKKIARDNMKLLGIIFNGISLAQYYLDCSKDHAKILI
jgi:hypothetical protein